MLFLRPVLVALYLEIYLHLDNMEKIKNIKRQAIKFMSRKKVIYCIKSTVDDRLYIGSTVQGFVNRIERHKIDLVKNRHDNIYLQNFVNKHGTDKLKFEILEIVEDKESLLEREQFWIDWYWDTGLLFNIARDAKAPMFGRKHTEEELEKMREAKIGHKHSEETKRKIGLALKGKTNAAGHTTSEETKKKISQANKGRKLSEESKAKMRGFKNRLGKKHTEEAKEKMSLAKKGNKYCLGRKLSEETKQKIGLASFVRMVE